MNTLIRTQSNINEIHIADLKEKNKKIILYDSVGIKNSYSLAIFASGDFFEIKDVMKLLKIQISKEEILQKEFSGNLKPYKYLKKFFLDLEKDF